MTNYRYFIRIYFLNYFLPLVLISFILLLIPWYKEYHAEKKVYAVGERKNTDAVAVLLSNEVNMIIGDLEFLAKHYELQKTFSSIPGQHLKKLAYDFLNFSQKKKGV